MNADEKIALTLADLKVALKELSGNIADAAPPKDQPPVPPSMDFTKTDIALNMQDPKTVRGLTDFVQKILIPQLRAGDRTDPRASLEATQKTTVIAERQLDYLKKQYNVDMESSKGVEELVNRIKSQNKLASDQYSLGRESANMLEKLNASTNRMADQSTTETDINLDPLQASISQQTESVQQQYDVSMSTNSLLTAMKDTAEMQLYTAQDAEERLKTEKQVVTEAQGVVIQDIDKDAAGVLGGIFGKLKGLFGGKKQSQPAPSKKDEENWLWSLLAAGASGIMSLLGGGVTSMVGKVIGKTFGLGTTIMKKSWGFAKTLATKTGGLIKSGLSKSFSVGKDLLKKGYGSAKNLGMKTFGVMKDGLSKSFSVGKDLFAKGTGFAKNLGSKTFGVMKDGLSKSFNLGKDLFAKTFDVGKGLLSKSAGFAKNIGMKAAGALKGGLGNAFTVGKGLFSKFTGVASNIGMKAASALRGGLGKAFTVGKGLFGKLAGTMSTGLATIGANAGTGVLGAVKGAMPSGGGLLKTVGKLAKFAGPIGALVTGGMAVFDGIGGAMDEYKKSGSITAAAREGVAAAASGLTFGLVDQETFSGIFSTVGDALGPVGDWMGGQMEAGWSAVTNVLDGNFSDALASAGEMLTFGIFDSDTIKNFGAGVSDTLGKAGSFLSEGASSIWDSVSGFFSNSPDVWDVLNDSGKTLGEGTAKVSESTAKVAKDAELHAKTTEEQSKGLGSMVGDLFMNFTPLGMAGKMAAKGVGKLVDGVKGLFSGSDSGMSDADKDMKDQIHKFMNKIFDWFDEAIEELETRERTTVEAQSSTIGSMAKDLWTNLTPIGMMTKAISDRDEKAAETHDKKLETSNRLIELDKQAIELANKPAESNNDGLVTGIKSAEDRMTAIEASNNELVTKMSSLIEIQQQQLSILETGNQQRGALQGEMANAAKTKAPTIINNSSSSNNTTTVQAADSNIMSDFRGRVYGGAV